MTQQVSGSICHDELLLPFASTYNTGRPECDWPAAQEEHTYLYRQRAALCALVLLMLYVATQMKQWRKVHPMCWMQSREVLNEQSWQMQKVWTKMLLGVQEVRARSLLALVLTVQASTSHLVLKCNCTAIEVDALLIMPSLPQALSLQVCNAQIFLKYTNTSECAESDDSQYEDGIEGDEASMDAALDSLDNDEPSFVDSHANFSSSDDESID